MSDNKSMVEVAVFGGGSPHQTLRVGAGQGFFQKQPYRIQLTQAYG